MNNSLSRRIYNSSLTLAISFGFYALIFAFTFSCDAEEGTDLPNKSAIQEVKTPVVPADTSALLAEGAVSDVEKIAN